MVTTTASNGELLIRDIAGPLKIPWVQIAYTLLAPALNNLNQNEFIRHEKKIPSRYEYFCDAHSNVPQVSETYQ